jgi:hypothetical protein
MTKETSTLAELNVKPGDVVSAKERVPYPIFSWTDGKCYALGEDGECYALGEDGFSQGEALVCDTDGWRIVSRASCAEDQPPAAPKTWGKMTDAEKGAILLAEHRGEIIECYQWPDYGWQEIHKPKFDGYSAYRVRPPEPKRETVTIYGQTVADVYGGSADEWVFSDYAGGSPHRDDRNTHRITLPLLDDNIPAGTYTSEAGETIIVEEL